MPGENDSSIRGAWFANQAYEKNGPSGPRSLQHQILQEETEADLSSGSNLRNRSSEESKRIPAKLGAKQANGNGTSERAPSDPPGGVKEESEEDDHKKKDEQFVLEHAINLQHDVEHQIEILAVKKSQLPPWKIAFLGTLSGFWMALSGSFAFSAAGGMEESLVKMFPVLPKLTLALLAPVAMHFIVIFGGEFYSGNCMFMSVGYFKGRLTLTTLLYNWASVFFWNLMGCLIGVWLFCYSTDIFADEPQLSFIIRIAESKAKMDPWIVFLRAIPANFLICLAIQMGIASRDMFGKIITLHMPLTVYTVAGFEHAVGNLVIFPLGIMYGADADIGEFIFNNLIPAILGNAVGGCLIGYIETLLFSWDFGLGNTNQAHNHTDQRKRADFNLQLPLANTYTKSRLKSTRDEINTTLARIEEAKKRLEELEQRRVPVVSIPGLDGGSEKSSPLITAPSPPSSSSKDYAAYRAALTAAATHSRSSSRMASPGGSKFNSFILPSSPTGAEPLDSGSPGKRLDFEIGQASHEHKDQDGKD